MTALILKSLKNEDEVQEFVKLVYDIQEVLQRTSLSLSDLDNKAHEIEKKVADLEPTLKKLEHSKKQLRDLTKQREKLAGEVVNLEQKYQLLNPRVKDLEKREQDLSRRIEDRQSRAQKAEATLAAFNKETQRLQDMGFSFGELGEFTERVQKIAKRHAIQPGDVLRRLLHELETLDKGLGLEELVKSRQQELDNQNQAILQSKQDLESTRAAFSTVKQEKVNLETSIKESRDKVLVEIAKITPLAKSTIKEVAEELRRGHDEALTEIRRLRDEALEAGKEIGRYHGIVETNEYLSGLPTLVRGGESLKCNQVRVILLPILRGSHAWLKHHEGESSRYLLLRLALESAIREVEQWKV